MTITVQNKPVITAQILSQRELMKHSTDS